MGNVLGKAEIENIFARNLRWETPGERSCGKVKMENVFLGGGKRSYGKDEMGICLRET